MGAARHVNIRLASAHDAPAIAAIYGPFCEATAVSFEVTAPSPEEIAHRIAIVTPQYPWLVLERDGTIAGYAYATKHRERAAYQWAVDTAVYVETGARRLGIGRALYHALFHLLRAQDYFKAYAGITVPNPASVALHERVGFTPVGVYRGVGFKLGEWHDIAWFQRALQDERLNPDSPHPLSAIGETVWNEAVSLGLKQYRGDV